MVVIHQILMMKQYDIRILRNDLWLSEYLSSQNCGSRSVFRPFLRLNEGIQICHTVK